MWIAWFKKRDFLSFFFPSPYWICYSVASVWCFGGVLVPQLRLELAPSALEGETNTREVPRYLPELAFLLSYQKPYLSFWFWKKPTQTRDKQAGGNVIFREVKRVGSWGTGLEIERRPGSYSFQWHPVGKRKETGSPSCFPFISSPVLPSACLDGPTWSFCPARSETY